VHSGKGGKIHYIPLELAAQPDPGLLKESGLAIDLSSSLLSACSRCCTGTLNKVTTAHMVYIRCDFAPIAEIQIGAHAGRATTATNALDHQADIAKVQEWLGQANIATTRICDQGSSENSLMRKLS
jgi:hypothetical protein